MQKTQTKPNPKLTPIVPLQPHTPPSITTISRPLGVPKPGSVHQGARDLTTEEKAARYDQMVNIKAQKRIALLRIGKLKRQLEHLDLEENKVLEDDYPELYEMIVEAEPCSNCGFMECVCERG